MNKKFILFYCLLILTLLVFVFIAYKNYKNKQNILGAMKVATISKKDLIFPKNSGFKYYSELIPSTESSDTHMWDNGIAHYTFNKDGLNERFDYSSFPTEGVYRILALGDSFTFGQFVDTKNNWTEKLEDLLNQKKICANTQKYEVLNLGMRAFDIPYIVQRYNDKGLKYHPDIIIWFESGSGFNRYNEIMQPEIEACQENIASNSSTSSIKNDFYPCWTKALENLEKNYTTERINKDLREWMAKFFKINNNTLTIFGLFSSTSSDEKNELNIRIGHQSNVFIFDKVSDLKSINGEFPDGHPNEKGHEMIAKDIYQQLADNKSNLSLCN